MFLSELCEFPSALCLAGEKKLGDSSCLHVIEIVDWCSDVSLSGCVVTDTALLKYGVL
jgi:hypothetical protein